jgi:hypothetical protein
MSPDLQPIQEFAGKFSSYIINPLLALLFGVGVVVFVWGLVQYLYALNVKGEQENEEGKKHMLWGLVGMFIMAAALTIIKIISNTVGADSLLPSTFR